MTSKFKGRGITQLTGQLDEMFEYGLQPMMWSDKVKIVWERLPGLQLRAQPDIVPIQRWCEEHSYYVPPRGRTWGLNEHDIDPIQRWCKEHSCGIRTSFDTFKFRKPSDVSMFLLRWGQ